MLKRISSIQIARVLSISSIIWFVLISGLSDMLPGALRNVNVGDEAPNFVLQDTNSREISLTSLRGKIVIIVFWRAGQKRCIEALTSLQSIYMKFKEQGVEVLALSSGGLELISKTKQEKQRELREIKVELQHLQGRLASKEQVITRQLKLKEEQEQIERENREQEIAQKEQRRKQENKERRRRRRR